MFKIPERIQIISFCRFCDAVDNGTGICTIQTVDQLPCMLMETDAHSGVRYSKEDIKRRKVERKFDKRSIKKNWRLQTLVKGATWGQVLESWDKSSVKRV